MFSAKAVFVVVVVAVAVGGGCGGGDVVAVLCCWLLVLGFWFCWCGWFWSQLSIRLVASMMS